MSVRFSCSVFSRALEFHPRLGEGISSEPVVRYHDLKRLGFLFWI